MDFGYSEEQEDLRHEVREFIRENWTPEVQAEIQSSEEGERSPRMKEIFRKIAERGWMGISWPTELGGHNGSRIDQYIVEEEFAWAGLPGVGGGPGTAPTILAAGSEEQKAYFIPRLLSGEVSFAQGFTEPSGGADLASLQCRAVEDGDYYVINGQKIFTSAAHRATHIYLMCRTDPEAPKHRGISIFLIPMNTPGISVRPLWTMQTEDGPSTATYHATRTNETFFDDVRVPKSSMLGEKNRGWYIGAMGLNLDRVGAGRLLIGIRQTRDFIEFIKSNKLNGYSLAEVPAIRDKLAELWIESRISELMTMRSMSIVEHGKDFTYEGSAEKVWTPEHAVKSVEAIAEMIGPYMQLTSGPYSLKEGQFAASIRGAYLAGVNHGSVQVMRDQIAVRGLGLPRAS